MSRVLIKEIDIWTVLRTVFPLAWIATTFLFMLTWLLAGGIFSALADEISGLPAVDPTAGVAAGVLLSLITGFMVTIPITICAAIVATAYNFLAALGGGITVTLEEQPVAAEPPTDEPAGNGSEVNIG